MKTWIPALILGCVAFFLATEMARLSGVLTSQANFASNYDEIDTMTTLTRYKYDSDGQLILTLTWTKEDGETFTQFLARVNAEWAEACAAIG